MNRRTTVELLMPLLLAAGALLFGMSAATAQTGNAARSTFVTPFPPDGTYKISVFGDGLAGGLADGLKQGLRLEPDIRVDNKSKPSSRLLRVRPVDWPAHMRSVVTSDPFQIAVMNFGLNDRVPVTVGGKRYRPGTPQWRGALAKRIDKLLRATRAKGAAVYWVGIPAMRGPKTSADMQSVNDIARERVYRHGGKFVDTWEGFTDAEGNYSAYGPDLTGKTRQLRTKDGVYLTTRGFRKLAHYVERLIRRDITLARAGREVPLAGGPEEQRQVRRLAGTQRRTASNPRARQNSGAAANRDSDGQQLASDHKADHATVRFKVSDGSGSKKKTVQIRLVRPALPAAVVGHLQRRSRASNVNRLGRNLLQFDTTGVGLVSSVTAGLEQGGGGLARGVSVTQSPYYKTLIKGETLPTKPGRADDFSWPPQQRAPYPGTGS